MCFRLGSVQSARFLELGFRMLTEGEPQEKMARLGPSPPGHGGPLPDSTGHGHINDMYYNHHDEMPAFPERGGPPPLVTADQVILFLGDCGSPNFICLSICLFVCV